MCMKITLKGGEQEMWCSQKVQQPVLRTLRSAELLWSDSSGGFENTILS